MKTLEELEAEIAALAQLAQREAEVEQLHHINDACIELENQLRAALEQRDQACAALVDCLEWIPITLQRRFRAAAELNQSHA